jgi:hypothetical protein
VAVAIFALREIALTPLTGLLAARLAGIALGLGTAVLYGYGYGRLRPGTGSDARPRGSWIAWAAASFAAQGAWETCLLGTRSYSQEASRFFLLLVFAGCFLLTIPILLVRRIGVGGREWKYGAILGLCAMLGTTYRLDAIRELGGLIVFPTTTIAGILVAQAAGRWIWGERLPYTWVGLAMGVTAILLMTLRFGP